MTRCPGGMITAISLMMLTVICEDKGQCHLLRYVSHLSSGLVNPPLSFQKP